MRPGPRNLITDVAGLRVGNAEDGRARSGVSVVLTDAPAVAAVDVRGGAPGVVESALLDPACLVEAVDAVVLSGGSAFGLAAATGVQSWLAARGRGFAIGPARVPIVPGAILFDLLNGGDKAWGELPPYRALAMTACDAAASEFRLGNAGAGLGATAGPLKGGLGSASVVTEEGFVVGALVACNSFGSAVMPGSDSLWAWPYEMDEEMGGQSPPARGLLPGDFAYDYVKPIGGQTTIAVVATDAVLSKAEMRRVAIMAHDGFARALRPVHTPFDGDSIFALATGRREVTERRPRAVSLIGMLAADCLARAIGRAIYQAETLGEAVSYRSRHGAGLRRR